MNIKVLYRLAITIEILIFEIVLMRTRQEKRSNRSRVLSLVQFQKLISIIIANIAKRYGTFMFISIPSIFL